jgi:hypothetical protein
MDMRKKYVYIDSVLYEYNSELSETVVFNKNLSREEKIKRLLAHPDTKKAYNPEDEETI